MVDVPNYDPEMPLLICDADEVLVQFISGLERYLNRANLYLDLTSFRIHGNIRKQDTHQRIDDQEVSNLLQDFFQTDTAHLEPVEGAASALKDLSEVAQILILSNLPASSRQARLDNLARHGMAFPVMAGSGPKGPIVQSLIKSHRAPIAFVDDLPPHHQSVADCTPHVSRLHFVADPRLAKLVAPCPHAHARIDNWPEAGHWLRLALTRP